MRIVRVDAASRQFMEWRREASDAERAPFQAARVVEFIEVYSYLLGASDWRSIRDIAVAVGTRKHLSRLSQNRQMRRVLRVLERAGYVKTRCYARHEQRPMEARAILRRKP